MDDATRLFILRNDPASLSTDHMPLALSIVDLIDFISSDFSTASGCASSRRFTDGNV
jgi:hypothetical protein